MKSVMLEYISITPPQYGIPINKNDHREDLINIVVINS